MVTFGADGNGKINGEPMRWQTLGPILATEQNSDTAGYTFQVEGGKLMRHRDLHARHQGR